MGGQGSTDDVQRNAIGVDGAEALAEALQQNRSLTLLDISVRRLCSGRRAALTPRLQGNAVGDAGARALAKALEKNDSLKALGVGVRLQSHSGEGATLTFLG